MRTKWYVAVAAFGLLGLVASPMRHVGLAQDGYSLLDGAIDLHLHIDPDRPTAAGDSIELSGMKFARAQGIRGFVIKNHYESTAAVAYLVRKEIPGVEAFGGITLNRNQGGINLAAVEYMATLIKGQPFLVVWMPTYDAEDWIRNSDDPNRPFVRVSQDGELVPEVKEMISLIARHDLVLATGHVSAEEGLLLVREGQRQGVQHMIVTHPMIASISMSEALMKEAASLGAFLEFDFRNLLPEHEEVDMIRTLGPEHVVIDEFWTDVEGAEREYGRPAELAAWVKAMNDRGFSNRELDMMVKDNPATLLGLPAR